MTREYNYKKKAKKTKNPKRRKPRHMTTTTATSTRPHTRGALAKRAHHDSELGGGDHAVLVLVKEHEGFLEFRHQVVRQPVLNLKKKEHVRIGRHEKE